MKEHTYKKTIPICFFVATLLLLLYFQRAKIQLASEV